jgi:hypothetical protein
LVEDTSSSLQVNIPAAEPHPNEELTVVELQVRTLAISPRSLFLPLQLNPFGRLFLIFLQACELPERDWNSAP